MECGMLGFDTAELLRLIKERCGLERFATGMQMSEDRILRLVFGTEEFTHAEMLLASKLLHLSNDEFNRCFFAAWFRNSELF